MFVTPSDELEEQVRDVLIERDVARLVTNHDPSKARSDGWREDSFECALEAWGFNNVLTKTLDEYLQDVREASLKAIDY